MIWVSQKSTDLFRDKWKSDRLGLLSRDLGRIRCIALFAATQKFLRWLVHSFLGLARQLYQPPAAQRNCSSPPWDAARQRRGPPWRRGRHRDQDRRSTQLGLPGEVAPLAAYPDEEGNSLWIKCRRAPVANSTRGESKPQEYRNAEPSSPWAEPGSSCGTPRGQADLWMGSSSRRWSYATLSPTRTVLLAMNWNYVYEEIG